MRRTIVGRAQVNRDIDRHFIHLAVSADFDTAERFHDAIHSAVRLVAESPHLGVARQFRNPALQNVRMWPIGDFSEYLLFYQPTRTGVRLIRLIHAKEDYRRILGPE